MNDQPHITQEAAREMLAALRYIESVLDNEAKRGPRARVGTIMANSMWDKASAAIARATGGEGV